MDFLKELFDEGGLTWEEFKSKVESKGFKVADLSTGNYVSKGKYNDDVTKRQSIIDDLNSQIVNRDTDITNLKTQLEAAGGDANKIADLNNQIATMQSQYANEKSEFENKLNRQAYEFAVREFANNKKFTSNAAKRDFISEMLKKDLKVENDKIIGADDFVSSYSEENKDAFVVENTDPKPNPSFVNPPNNSNPAPENAFINAFHFNGVRAKDNK